MKKIIITLFLLLNLFNISYSKDIKFIQATDVHYTTGNAQYLKDFVNEVNSNYKDIDFVVFTGDNIDKARGEDLWEFLDIVKKINHRVYVIPGNHDLQKNNKMTSKNYMYLVRKKLGFYHSNKPNYVFKKDGIVFITMNGVKEVFPGPGGYYQEEEVLWLDRQLTKYKDKKVVILQHFPLLDSPRKTANVWNKELYMKVLAKHKNVIAIISGHYHKNFEINTKGIYHILTDKFAGCGTYKIIEIDSETGFITTSLITK